MRSIQIDNVSQDDAQHRSPPVYSSLSVQALLEPSSNDINALAHLSDSQISQIESTLQRAKSTKSQSRTVRSNASRSSNGNAGQESMRPFMSILNQQSKVAPRAPATSPQLENRDGVQWLIFCYSSRTTTRMYELCADLDNVDDADIPVEFQLANCLYLNANGPKSEYKGTRREYERECNRQGWKLAHLNPDLLSGKKGVLQSAVVNLRNATLDQRSRRQKREYRKKEKDNRRTIANESSGQEQPLEHPPSGKLPIPRLVRLAPQPIVRQTEPRTDSSVTSAVDSRLLWRPPLLSCLSPHRLSHHPATLDATAQVSSAASRAEIHTVGNSQLNPTATTDLTSVEALLATIQRLPTLGAFQGKKNLIEFEGYTHGRFRKLELFSDIETVRVQDIPTEFKRQNCVYPRSFVEGGNTEAGQQSLFGIRQAEESYLNELGWRLCFLNSSLLSGKRLLLQQALDAYRRRFLPATCQPRARIVPSLLTRRNSTTNGRSDIPLSSHRSIPADRQQVHQEKRLENRVHFSTSSEKSKEVHGKRIDRDQRPVSNVDILAILDEFEEGAGLNDSSGSSDNEGGEDQSGEDFTTRESRRTSGTDEDEGEDSDADSSSSEDFHSRMSLLSFAGKIRTYSLGSGSGSARSRPRIDRASAIAALQPVKPGGSSKRKKQRRGTDGGHNGPGHEAKRQGKRVRTGHLEARATDKAESSNSARTRPSMSEDRASVNGSNVDEEEESNWWKSRLNDSEYPEDHEFVSMTTDELISALTGGYKSDFDDDSSVEASQDEERYEENE
ncbi:hypothetical protein BGW38_005985 [Lunasporangiospora selenospora]|uniref:DUF8032 domain-containing protein n=1 Tax=Lunasporangiospora selenospora TaxID=979761 RepID=A0A9P6G1C2_9FUNG|nr:hypothetical protein BGW38_005985 [Lunasporangiospora selenospora]